MRIESVEDEPLHQFDYSVVTPEPRTVVGRWPIYSARATGLPDGIAAVIAASDLQGRELDGGGRPGERLVGQVLAEQLSALADAGRIPELNRCGMLLAGDLHAEPDRRGGLGEVAPVYRALAERAAWVIAVHGNHDRLDPAHLQDKTFMSRVRIVDAQTTPAGGLVLGGVGGIIGRPTKPNRRRCDDFLAAVRGVLGSRPTPSVLLLHQGPDLPALRLPGSEEVRQCLAASGWSGLVVCGHKHWRVPLAWLNDGTQVLNLEGRCVVITPTSQ